MKNKLLLIPFLVMTLTSCLGNKEAVKLKASDGVGGNSTVTPDLEPTYQNVYEHILGPKCAECHSLVEDESELAVWIVDGQPEQSPLFTSVEDGSMPINKSPLASAELDLIRRYIEQFEGGTYGQGGTETGGTSGGGNNYITFEQLKSTILVPYKCVNCHAMNYEADMAAWVNKSNPSASKLYTSVNNNSMPTSNPKLTTAQKAFVLQYVQDYAATH